MSFPGPHGETPFWRQVRVDLFNSDYPHLAADDIAPISSPSLPHTAPCYSADYVRLTELRLRQAGAVVPAMQLYYNHDAERHQPIVCFLCMQQLHYPYWHHCPKRGFTLRAADIKPAVHARLGSRYVVIDPIPEFISPGPVPRG